QLGEVGHGLHVSLLSSQSSGYADNPRAGDAVEPVEVPLERLGEIVPVLSKDVGEGLGRLPDDVVVATEVGLQHLALPLRVRPEEQDFGQELNPLDGSEVLQLGPTVAAAGLRGTVHVSTPGLPSCPW